MPFNRKNLKFKLSYRLLRDLIKDKTHPVHPGMPLIFICLPMILMACSTDQKQSDPMSSVEEGIVDSIPADQPTYSVSYITGKFNPSEDDRFVMIEAEFADEEGMYLREEAYEAFLKMHDAAEAEGIDLTILSATRNFDVQRSIWESKWTGHRLVEDGTNLAKTVPDPVERALRILRYSSMPGTSRHHWGTDIDLNALNNEYFKAGEGARVYRWLKEHAREYGYCQPYTKKGEERSTGYEEERWHWSYLPLAQPLLDQAKNRLKNDNISGFKGAETAPSIQVVERYVFGISPECQGG